MADGYRLGGKGGVGGKRTWAGMIETFNNFKLLRMRLGIR